MPVNVYIPTPFRSFTGNRTNVEIEAATVADLLARMDEKYPGFRNLCSDEHGGIPRHINIYVNNKEISTLDGPDTRLADGDQVAVIPALAGGNTR
ncbi:MAG TPA: MoaD/ThiS family protein [Dehalococcoidia bacterium]|nr:MoaD/ThiS family protein [Dehalococcoidia bacterium]